MGFAPVFLFQTIYTGHLIQFHAHGGSKLLQIEHQMFFLYLLYLSGYMFHGTGKNLHLLAGAKSMIGGLY